MNKSYLCILATRFNLPSTAEYPFSGEEIVTLLNDILVDMFSYLEVSSEDGCSKRPEGNVLLDVICSVLEEKNGYLEIAESLLEKYEKDLMEYSNQTLCSADILHEINFKAAMLGVFLSSYTGKNYREKKAVVAI